MQEIHAFFESMSNARKVQKLLIDSGYNSSYLDLASSFDYEFSTEINTAGTESAPNLSTLILRSGGHFFDMEKAPLISAGNSISGKSCMEDCRDISARLSIKLDGTDTEQAKNIISENGGRIL